MSFSGKSYRIPSLESRFGFWVLAVALLGIGLGIRFFDITDPTFQTRQLHGAVLARGMYYQMDAGADPHLRDLAISFWKSTTQYEPPILEQLTAITYLVIGGEAAWIGRIYSSIFWVIGGIGLLALARRMFAENASTRAVNIASLACLGYYLLSPFAVDSSRDIQSDPGMVMWSIFFLYAMFVWIDRRSWITAFACGLLGGIAILVKATAVFVLVPAFLALVLYNSEWKKLWKSPQAWLILFLLVVPTLIYSFTSRLQGDAVTYFENTTLAVSSLLSKPTFYISWISFLNRLISLPMLLLGFLGMMLSPARSRLVMIGIWAGYGIYAAVFPHQIYTHDYYHLRMVPVIGLSIIPALSILVERIDFTNWTNRILFAALVLLAVGFPVWQSYSNFSKVDNRSQANRWQEIGDQLPEQGKIVALTQEYGFPLMFYGWKKVQIWPSLSEQELKSLRGNPKKFEQLWEENTKGDNYFLVTNMEQFLVQSELREYLMDNYPLLIDEEDMLLFQLSPSPD